MRLKKIILSLVIILFSGEAYPQALKNPGRPQPGIRVPEMLSRRSIRIPRQAQGHAIACGLRLPAVSGGQSSICSGKDMKMCSLIPPQAAGNALDVGFSRFISRLQSLPAPNRQALADSILQAAAESGMPVLEDTLAHFLYSSDQAFEITLAGDFNGWDPSADSLKPISGTDLFYLTKVFERDARLDYKYVLDGQTWILDPLNPRVVRGGFGDNSELAMPGYQQPDEIRYFEAIPHGSIEGFTHHSPSLNNDRKVWVYLPPGYAEEPARRYPSLYVNDGGEYQSLADIRNVLDFLMNAGRIEDLIMVLVDPVDRMDEYACHSGFRHMLVQELVPRIDSLYRTIRDPARRGVMGASLGGLASVHAAWGCPDVFCLSASQSGAFWIHDGQIMRDVAAGPPRKVRFHLDWGRYERQIRESNLEMLGVLQAAGCPVSSREYHEGHSWGSWRAHMDEILKYFFPAGE